MKKLFLFAFLAITSFSFGQITKFSIEAAYPLPVDKNFVGDNYKGIADIGLKYRILNLRVVNFGFSVNGSYLTANDSGYFPAYDETLDFKSSLYIIEPRLFAEINLKGITKLRPSAGIGYAFFMADQTFDASGIPDQHSNEGGMNINLGLSYDILKKLYILAHYDYTVLSQLEAGVPDSSYNTNVSILKIGLGLRL